MHGFIAGGHHDLPHFLENYLYIKTMNILIYNTSIVSVAFAEMRVG
jgi:hypothetical protein